MSPCVHYSGRSGRRKYSGFCVCETVRVAVKTIGVLSVGIVLVTALPAFAAKPKPPPVVVDTCGQILEGDGILMADLDCSAAALPSVMLTKNGTFSLNGHTLTGEVRGDTSEIAVVGPGSITGPGYGVRNERTPSSFRDLPASRIVIDGVTITGNDDMGVFASAIGKNATVTIVDSTISNNGGAAGVRTEALQTDFLRVPRGKVTVERSTISANLSTGIWSNSVLARDSQVVSNGASGVLLSHSSVKLKLKLINSSLDDNVGNGVVTSGFRHARVIAVDSSISGNDIGITDSWTERPRIKLKRSNVDGNRVGVSLFGSGVRSTKTSLRDSTIAGSAENGIYANSTDDVTTLARSSVMGSGSSAECGVSISCADLNTVVLPRIKAASTCDTSHVNGSGIPGQNWGVCALD